MWKKKFISKIHVIRLLQAKNISNLKYEVKAANLTETLKNPAITKC